MTDVIELHPDIGPEVETHESAKAHWRTMRVGLFDKILKPKPRLTLSQWADERRMLDAENAEDATRWSTDRVPYLREMMDATTDPRIPEVVMVKAAQIGFTQGVILNGIGYYIDQDPSPLLVVQPSDGDAEKFSKEKLAPMLRETECLRGKVADSRSRDSDNTILAKSFAGGHLGITGATSPKGLRARSRRVVFFDEVDGYPPSAGAEGDPITLGKKRTIAFRRRKIVYGSTPTIKFLSRVWRLFEESDQRYCYVPCPHCGFMQRLIFGGKKIAIGLKWEPGRPETAHYICEDKGCRIEERHKPRMLQRLEWRAHNPGHWRRGYHISALYSMFPGAAWPVIAREFLEAQSKPEELQGFINTVLAELWEGVGESVSSHELAKRYEHYTEKGDVPKGVAVLTRSVDVQLDRLETEVYGWGAGTECWPIEHKVIPGDTRLPEDNVHSPWRELAPMLRKGYRHELGFSMVPRVTFIDSGDGGTTDAVYKFCRRRLKAKVFPIKGANDRQAPLLSEPKRLPSAKVILYHVGVSTAKGGLLSRLAKNTTAGPGYIHIPEWMDDDKLNQITAEKLIPVPGRPGQPARVVWTKTHDRNEQLDLWVYAYAALHQLGTKFVAGLENEVKKLAAQYDSGTIQRDAVVTGTKSSPRGRRVLSNGIIE